MKAKTVAIGKTTSRELLIHPWSPDCVNVLDKTFRLKRFRPNQLEAINGTLSGKDVFVLMPTGGGKSLCYQLPSQVSSGKTSGVTIVVSPLISLINDQVDHLTKLRISAIPFTSDLPAQDKKRALQVLNGGPSGNDSVDGWIVYVTPEMLNKSAGFQSLLRQIYRRGKLARFVIDEAHCVSSVRLLLTILALILASTLTSDEFPSGVTTCVAFAWSTKHASSADARHSSSPLSLSSVPPRLYVHLLSM